MESLITFHVSAGEEMQDLPLLLSQEELMEHVWDASVDSFSGAIRVHMSSLRRKLKAVLGYDPILNKVGEGYKLREESDR